MVHSLIGAIHIKEREPAPTSSASVPALCFSTLLYIKYIDFHLTLKRYNPTA